jgi:hypothetical protein
MKMTKDEFKLVERWFYRNARPLDMARWKYHFEGGSADDVARIMECYQAADGGLGNGIEADLWNPRPCPATTARGIGLLHEVGFDDRESDLAKLRAVGFEVVSEANHYKLKFRGSEKYWFTLFKTPSDGRAGKNLVSDITKTLSVYK